MGGPDVLTRAQSPHYRALVPADDLGVLPASLQSSVRITDGGEVLWPLTQAADAINALADARRIILGLDLRDYADDGSFVEIAWSSFQPEGADAVEGGRRDALTALRRPELPGSWVLVTWTTAT